MGLVDKFRAKLNEVATTKDNGFKNPGGKTKEQIEEIQR